MKNGDMCSSTTLTLNWRQLQDDSYGRGGWCAFDTEDALDAGMSCVYVARPADAVVVPRQCLVYWSTAIDQTARDKYQVSVAGAFTVDVLG